MKKQWLMTILYILLLDFVVALGLLGIDHWYVKLLYYILPGCAITIRILTADKKEREYAFSNQQISQVSPYVAPQGLPLLLTLFIVLFLPIIGLVAAISYFFGNFILVFLHISIYNAVLMLLLPLLRKHISSRVCATLWILPNVLYIALIPLVQKDHPLFIIPANITIGSWITLVWLIGFAAVMLYQITNHLLYRRKILKNAKQDYSLDAQRIWYDTLDNVRFKNRYYPVMRSAEVTTPLSVGFFRKTACVILPEKEYTAEELQLILRHEAIHIARRDSLAKFFMVFCAAVCWFNPLAWIALRHCTADMELSCDETVLLGENDETKRRYADLLLKTAGNDRGFSTCLSASAKTMLYRLTHTLNPKKRFLGAFTAGIITVFLLGTFGMVSVSYNPVEGSELIYDTLENVTWLNDVVYNIDGKRTEFEDIDVSPFQDYISTITFYQLPGNYAYEDDTTRITLGFQTDDYTDFLSQYNVISDNVVELHLSDHKLTILYFVPTVGFASKVYYHNADVDWDYLLNLATPTT